tara:strand:+ start:1636 stop:1929 length:294 start_codon:yes stop_codon:yes gene_type:complete
MSGHQKRWKERFGFMAKKNIKILELELGCFKGEMSKWFSDNLLENRYSRLYCVDTWEGSEEYKQNYSNVKKTFKNTIETTFHNNIKKSKHPKKIKVF